MGIKDNIKNQAKEEIKSKAKTYVKKILLTYIVPPLLGIIIIAGGFLVITGAIKDAAETVVKAATSIFSTDFDNTSDTPTIIISDEMIKAIKDEMKNQDIDIEETFLTDDLLKRSLEAYYSTQYPYIDGINYTDDMVKGSIYLKRGDNNTYMSYINYNSFKEKLGDGKAELNVNDVKKYFSMDDDNNIVIATWSQSSEIVQYSDNGYKEEGNSENTYSITEYKIDQKTLSAQYAMSYKLPILLANLYSNEGFGLAVAELGKNAKIELTILDSTTETETVSKEYFKMNYKVNGTYDWGSTETNSITRENLPELPPWVKDYTTDAYKITTQTIQENSITVKTTLVDTWIAKGEVTDITKNTQTTSNSDNPDIIQMDNDSNYIVDPNTTITDEQRGQIIQKILESKNGTITEEFIKEINATVYKQMTDHSTSTVTTITQTTYASSDMELIDNTDKFLALIKSNGKGEFDEEGELVEYTKKEGVDDSKYDIESEFLSSIDMLIDILENDEEISSYANTMKYIYYRYTKDESYKTNLDFSSYDTSDFKDVGSTASSGSGFEQFKKWLHGWEGGSVSKDGKFYIVESDGSKSGSAVGHGVDIGTHGAELRAAGYDTSIGSKIPVDVVDAIEEKEINEKISAVKSQTKGLELTDYQIYALVSRAYNCGVSGAFTTRNGLNFKQAYNKYWKQDRDDKYGKKEQVDYTHNLYSKYMYLPNTSDGEFLQGLENRRKSEWLLFQTGWFDDRGNVNEYCSTNSGGDFLEVAKKCWVTVCTSGKYTTYGGSSIPAKGPTIDCSSYVSWVLYEYGYKDFKGWQHTAQTFYQTNWKKKYGWEEIQVGSGENPKDKLQPGDIFVRYGSGTHHVTIVESIKNGKLYAYDCGNSANWLQKGGNGNSIDKSYFLTEQGSGKIIRVTAPNKK